MLLKLRSSELHSETEKQKCSIFDNIILKKPGDSMTKKTDPPDAMNHVPYEDSIEPKPIKFPDDNDPVDSKVRSFFEKPTTDQWINAELNLPQGNTMKSAKVISQSKNLDGEEVGSYNENPFLNTLVYDVQFPDGKIKEYVVNVIAENINSQVDS